MNSVERKHTMVLSATMALGVVAMATESIGAAAAILGCLGVIYAWGTR
jgi:hypothetical protein